MNVHDFRCEYCDGTVRERVLQREPISLSRGIVVLENVPIGVCDRCSAHYYGAAVLRRAESILRSTTPPARTMEVPVEAY